MVNSQFLDFILMTRLGKNEEIWSGGPWGPRCSPNLQVQGPVFFLVNQLSVEAWSQQLLDNWLYLSPLSGVLGVTLHWAE